MTAITPDLLRRFRCFTAAGDANLAQIATAAREETCAADEVIFREGSKAENVYVVLEGEVDLKAVVPSGERKVVDTIAAGEMLGWSGFVRPHTYRSHAVARSAARLLVIDTAKLRELMEADHALGHSVMGGVATAMAHRLEGARRRLAQS
jgi:CRP-like cAMP-binding protein